ncbi:hypothetical protein [Moorena producens]|uniref:hypothetical protein n=1 Tax=Moorena producens TaxID=1155739 RepID=UPI0011EA707C|nr:hypothetical protein [Moorena producens]
MPTPPNGIGFRRRCANGYSASFINDTVRSYRKKSGAFMVSRLCIKEVRPVANLIRQRKAHLWLKLYD